MRLSSFTWPFPFLVRLGWASAGVPNPEAADARGRVYLLRGNGIVFSRGIGRLCTLLRRAGFWAEDLRCVGDRWVCRRLIADHRAGRLREPVVLVGHSCGGRYALFAAQKLARLGIGVDLLVCLDVAMPYEVAGNVKKAIHLYLAGPRIYPARPLRRGQGSSAEIENIDLKAVDSPVPCAGLQHLNITDSPALQAYVMRRIVESIPVTEPDAVCSPTAFR